MLFSCVSLALLLNPFFFMKRSNGFLVLMMLVLIALVAQFESSLHAQTDDDDKWEVPMLLGKDGWQTYQNARFGMEIPVPPTLVPQRPPDNGGGQAFASPDGKVRLIVFGMFNVDDLSSVEAAWKTALNESEQTITYKRKTETWFVVSGVTKKGLGFYERYDANAKYAAGWRLTYPQAEDEKYSAWVERIAKGYRANLGKGVDTLQ